MTIAYLWATSAPGPRPCFSGAGRRVARTQIIQMSRTSSTTNSTAPATPALFIIRFAYILGAMNKHLLNTHICMYN